MSTEGPEQLMNTLISKMESMDADIQSIRAENILLKQMLDNPQRILRKAGFVPFGTPLSEDVEVDAFRSDVGASDSMLLKEDGTIDPDKYTNTEIHEMSWDEIHEMADQHREVKEMY